MTSEEVLKENKTCQNRFSSMLPPEVVTGVKRKSESACEESSRPKVQKTSQKFIYGNYSRYYGYRKGDGTDPRIKIFEQHKELFTQKDILDIGCNDGSVTLEIANRFPIESITGIDIDKHLIGKAKKSCKYALKKSLNPNLLNVKFEVGNYVVAEESLQEERAQFDTILCLSVTKWIHLNFGDDGLKLMFKRIFAQLRPGGVLVLEAQPFDGYRRRKKLSETTLKHYKSIKLFPNDFKSYLLSEEIGYSQSFVINETTGAKGFDRPIQVFVKKGELD